MSAGADTLPAAAPFLSNVTVTLLSPLLFASIALPLMLTIDCVPTKFAMRSTPKLLNVCVAGLNAKLLLAGVTM